MHIFSVGDNMYVSSLKSMAEPYELREHFVCSPFLVWNELQFSLPFRKEEVVSITKMETINLIIIFILEQDQESKENSFHINRILYESLDMFISYDISNPYAILLQKRANVACFLPRFLNHKNRQMLNRRRKEA